MAFRRKRLYDGTIIYHPIVDDHIDLETNTSIQVDARPPMQNIYSLAKQWFNKIIILVKNS
jgi:hypothetical protein